MVSTPATRLSILVVALIVVGPAWGQAVASREPSSTHIFPAGGKRGSVVKVRIGGECFPPGMNLTILGAGVTGPGILGPEVKVRYEPSLRRTPRDADGVGASVAYPREFKASLAIAADAEPGVRHWRAWGGFGGTRLRPFLVGDLPEFIETEPNSQPELAERIALPVVVNGQIAGERDQDFFVFAARAGEVIVCDVMAARIGSPLDAVVAITDLGDRRQEVEEIRVGDDPVVTFRVPTTGDYRLHLANLGFGGGPAYVYRITVTTKPYVPFPEVATADGNHSFQTARELPTPGTVNGRFVKADAEDWFRFSAKKSEAFTITCRPLPHDSAAVPLLTVVGPDGAPLAKAGNIETPRRGFELGWTAPADGDFRLRLRDLQHGSRGGAEFAYHLAIRPARPDFSLRLEADHVNVVQGGKTEVDLLVHRSGGFAGQIALTAAGLPDGVTIEPPTVAGNQARVKLTVVARDSTRPVNAGLRIVGRTDLAGKASERTAVVPSFAVEGASLYLTVQHKPVFRLSCNEAYQYAHRGSIYPYVMKVERLDGFNGPITLQLCDRQVQDLDGIEVVETVIAPDAKEVKNLIYLPETMHASVQHHSRPYAQAYASFTDKWGQKQTLLGVSSHRCMIRTLPPVVKLRALPRELVAGPGDVVECKLAVERISTFTSPLDLAMVEVAGFKAEKVHVAADKTEVSIRIQVGKDVRPATLTFRATGTLAGGATAITEATLPVRIK